MKKYSQTHRRILIDTQINDNSPEFLSKYDPIKTAEIIEEIGADGAMIYFQNHIGLSFFPDGFYPHNALKGRDFAKISLNALNAKGIPVCAYYSIGFNNRAYQKFPNWRIQPTTKTKIGNLKSERYGIVCINNPEYGQFIEKEIQHILDYEPQAMFFDMVWWNGVCVCPSCRAKFHAEYNAEIPEIKDDNDANWLNFQKFREESLKDFTIHLREMCKTRDPKIEVYHNFALGLANWTRGIKFDLIKGHDFLGGDFYGNFEDQILICKLMNQLTPNRPAEFMTSVSRDLTHHTLLRGQLEFNAKIAAAEFSNCAFLGILSFSPDGTIDRRQIEIVKNAFSQNNATNSKFEEIGKIALYFSDNSRLNRFEKPCDLSEIPKNSAPQYDHYAAFSNMARILFENHILFKVVTKKDLSKIEGIDLLILPEVQFFDENEITRISQFVENGGKIYASRNSIFGLEKLFGVNNPKPFEGNCAYIRDEKIGFDLMIDCENTKNGIIEIGANENTSGKIILPYFFPQDGNAENNYFASIHTSPPDRVTEFPVFIDARIGEGRGYYCVANLENIVEDGIKQTVSNIICELTAPLIRTNAHKKVWLNAFKSENLREIRMINMLDVFPKIPIGPFWIEVFDIGNKKLAKAKMASTSAEIVIERHSKFARINIEQLKEFEVLILEFEP